MQNHDNTRNIAREFISPQVEQKRSAEAAQAASCLSQAGSAGVGAGQQQRRQPEQLHPTSITWRVVGTLRPRWNWVDYRFEGTPLLSARTQALAAAEANGPAPTEIQLVELQDAEDMHRRAMWEETRKHARQVAGYLAAMEAVLLQLGNIKPAPYQPAQGFEQLGAAAADTVRRVASMVAELMLRRAQADATGDDPIPSDPFDAARYTMAIIPNGLLDKLDRAAAVLQAQPEPLTNHEQRTALATAIKAAVGVSESRPILWIDAAIMANVVHAELAAKGYRIDRNQTATGA